MNRYQQNNSAFTLVELAIVIVIIGLLVGGVLQGQELIAQAKLRSTMKDIESYKTAQISFRAKYNCMPGDCPRAFTFFGTDCGTNTAITTTNTTGCNGNGNDVLHNAEAQLFWQHLSYAKLIKGSFSGGYKVDQVVGIDVPAIAAGNNTGVTAAFANGNANASNSCGYVSCIGGAIENILGFMDMKNVFQIGNTRPGAGGIAGAFYTPEQAYEMDLKFDDGVPFRGKISGFKARQADGSPTTCSTGQNNPLTANPRYCNSTVCPTSSERENCIMVFDMN
jgi:prepilin-type N-terminal cleavage/methylation domain-containing protein